MSDKTFLRDELVKRHDGIDPAVWIRSQTGLDPKQVGTKVETEPGDSEAVKARKALEQMDSDTWTILQARLDEVEMALDSEAGRLTWPFILEDGAIDTTALAQGYVSKTPEQRLRIFEVQVRQALDAAEEYTKGDLYLKASYRDPRYLETAQWLLGKDGRPGHADDLLDTVKKSVRNVQLGADRPSQDTPALVDTQLGSTRLVASECSDDTEYYVSRYPAGHVPRYCPQRRYPLSRLHDH